MHKRESADSTWTDGNFLRVSGAGCLSASVISHSVCAVLVDMHQVEVQTYLVWKTESPRP